ncbi:hypothetical protein PIB30_105695 [Stylosanthes scabra]|uniref:Uncharacterized protein n=1 Tax=Stylosanthes scabra TaxID=79078 RepID=A0ABU6QZS4_9FABA|nr:hypothetical protein [Stylosanthes scabra]
MAGQVKKSLELSAVTRSGIENDSELSLCPNMSQLTVLHKEHRVSPITELCALQDDVDTLGYVGSHVTPYAALVLVLSPNLQAKVLQSLSRLPSFEANFKLKFDVMCLTYITWWVCGGIQPPFSSLSAAQIACDLLNITCMPGYGVTRCLKFRKKNDLDSVDSDLTMANPTGKTLSWAIAMLKTILGNHHR